MGTVLNEKMGNKIFIKISDTLPYKIAKGRCSPKMVRHKNKKNSNPKTNQEKNKRKQIFFIPFKLFTHIFVRNSLIHTEDYTTLCTP